MASRSRDDLLPEVKVKVEALIAAAHAEGLKLLVTASYRSPDEQNALYAQGRTKPGRIVTKAKGWESWHQYRRAADLVPVAKDGNLWWAAPEKVWKRFGELAAAAGLEWGGSWKFPDRPHVQDRAGLSIAEAKAALNLG